MFEKQIGYIFIWNLTWLSRVTSKRNFQTLFSIIMLSTITWQLTSTGLSSEYWTTLKYKSQPQNVQTETIDINHWTNGPNFGSNTRKLHWTHEDLLYEDWRKRLCKMDRFDKQRSWDGSIWQTAFVRWLDLTNSIREMARFDKQLSWDGSI